MTGAGHTAGRWKAYKDGVHPVLEDGSNGNESYAICQCFGPDALANARLIVAACNSYDRHFGPRAVEAAEGDLLGNALEVLREIRRANPMNIGGAIESGTWAKIDAILSQVREVRG